MFNVGGAEVLVILLVALIVLGPDKLPEAAKKVGKVMGEIRSISSGFKREMQSALNDADRSSATRRLSEPPENAEPIDSVGAKSANDAPRLTNSAETSDASSGANPVGESNGDATANRSAPGEKAAGAETREP